jgi:hypothetical protein
MSSTTPILKSSILTLLPAKVYDPKLFPVKISTQPSLPTYSLYQLSHWLIPHTYCNPSTQEAEEGEWGVQGQRGQNSEFKGSLDYTVTLCLKIK